MATWMEKHKGGKNASSLTQHQLHSFLERRACYIMISHQAVVTGADSVGIDAGDDGADGPDDGGDEMVRFGSLFRHALGRHA